MALKKHKVSFQESNQFSSLFIDYINGNPKLNNFYELKPSVHSFKEILKANTFVNRKLLVDTINKQYKSSNLNAPNCDILLDEKTFTVCTGHQLCLFTGPLYFIYKIISTINLSEKLKKEYPEYNFVPVYWMATEDHDFEEISSVHLFGKTVKWENNKASGAVGNLETQSLELVIEELKTILGDSENAKELIQLFADAYLKQNNLADATRYLVYELFKEYNLIIIDANDTNLKREFSNFILDDILNNTNFTRVENSIKELNKLGYNSQVSPREINCFYLYENKRERIEKKDNSYSVLNTDIKFTAEEIKSELKNHPEKFSPNVVLRPLYQQYILPNIAYVGGPGEIAYWLEYKAMFNHHKINYPILIPRNFALLTDEKTNQQIEKLGFNINDFFKNIDELNKTFALNNGSSALSLDNEEKEIKKAFKTIIEKAISIDTTLKATTEAELQKTLNSLKNIESKFLRAEKQKQETSINQIKKIKNKFFPDGNPQERYENFSSFYLKSGKQFIAELKNEFNPFEFELLILELPS